MKKLLKEYGFNSDMQYFEMIVESVINGNRTQALEQFKAMPKQYQKEFIKALYGNWTTYLEMKDKNLFLDAL